MTDPDRLIDHLLDAELTAEQFAQLEQDLLNPRYADVFAQSMLIDQILKERFDHDVIVSSLRMGDGSFLTDKDLKLLADDAEHAEAELVDLERKLASHETKPTPRATPEDDLHIASTLGYLAIEGTKKLSKSKVSGWAALAAVLLLTAWLINPFANDTALNDSNNAPAVSATPPPRGSDNSTTHTPQPVATITATHNAVWDSQPAGDLRRGAPLTAGQRLTLTQGFTEITTKRGAIAIIEAPATIELLDNDNALRLHTGKLVGICETESSKGFLVRTPHMDITDLGTRFGVDASDSDSTDVHVYLGQVEVTRPDANQRSSMRVTQGQALRAEANLETFVSIEPDYTRFASGLGSFRLPGTGFGIDPLTKTMADANWQLVAVNGAALPQPLAMPVGMPLNYRDADWYDPAIARWLVIRETADYQGDEPGVYTLRTQLEIPKSVDLADASSLRLAYVADDSLQRMVINGQVVEAMQNPGTKDRGRQTRLIPLADTALRHGENTVELYLYNAPGTAVSLHMEWLIAQPPLTTD